MHAYRHTYIHAYRIIHTYIYIYIYIYIQFVQLCIIQHILLQLIITHNYSAPHHHHNVVHCRFRSIAGKMLMKGKTPPRRKDVEKPWKCLEGFDITKYWGNYPKVTSLFQVAEILQCTQRHDFLFNLVNVEHSLSLSSNTTFYVWLVVWLPSILSINIGFLIIPIDEL